MEVWMYYHMWHPRDDSEEKVLCTHVADESEAKRIGKNTGFSVVRLDISRADAKILREEGIVIHLYPLHAKILLKYRPDILWELF